MAAEPQQESKERSRDPPWEQKEGARQGANADLPLEEEGWGAEKPMHLVLVAPGLLD